MPNVKILHTGDIHIGALESFLGAKAESRRFETLMTFEKIVDLAQENNVQVVALAGDVFDSNTCDAALINGFFDKISKADKIKFVFAAGNHDPLDSRSPFLKNKLPQNLFVLGTKDSVIAFEDIGLKVWGRSFEGAFLKGEEKFGLNAYDGDYVNLMVQHGELKSDLNSEYNAITRAFITKSGMDYIALGHIHKRTDIGKLGDTYFSYCGCPEGQGFDEADQKGVYLGEIGKGFCKLEFFPVAKRMHIVEKVDISGLCNTAEAYGKIIADLKEKYGDRWGENLYKIILSGSIKEDCEISVSEIASRLSESAYFAKVKNETKPYIDLEVLSREASLKGIFVKNCLERIENANEDEKELYRKALDLGLKAFSAEVNCDED